jgi:hypothetical protein
MTAKQPVLRLLKKTLLEKWLDTNRTRQAGELHEIIE